MHIVLFCDSLMSDWNNGSASFLRGVASELIARGHEVTVYEPVDGVSRTQLVAQDGARAEERFHRAFPHLAPVAFDLRLLALDAALYDADLVLVHESTDFKVVERLARHKAAGARYILLFHDTHHHSVTSPEDIAACKLQRFDGVLASGASIRERYVRHGWSRRVWTWHEAADTHVFYPRSPSSDEPRDVVWMGNWGDDERSAEFGDYFMRPVRELQLTATAYGVRYPDSARREMKAAGVDYKGWIPSDETPQAYANHRFAVDIPRRPYMSALPGIPSIRVFEALACGIPLVTLDWQDSEGLFSPGFDYLVARTPIDMRDWCVALAADAGLRQTLARHGLETIRRRHTCAHRVDELLSIFHQLRQPHSEVMSA